MFRRPIPQLAAALALTGAVATASLAQVPEILTRPGTRLLEELQLIRAVKGSRLPQATVARVAAAVEQAYQTLEKGDAQAATTLAAQRQQLQVARRQVLAGQAIEGPTQSEVELAGRQRTLDQQRQGFLRTLRRDVEKLLQTLPVEEQPLAVAAGTLLIQARRSAEADRLLMDGGQQRISGNTTRDLDRLRTAKDPQELQRARLQFALRAANIPNYRDLPELSTRPGQRPDPRSAARAPKLNDPAIQARIRPFLQTADRLRTVPAAQWEQTRARIALETEVARLRGRVNDPVEPKDAVNELADALTRPSGREALRTLAGPPAATAQMR